MLYVNETTYFRLQQFNSLLLLYYLLHRVADKCVDLYNFKLVSFILLLNVSIYLRLSLWYCLCNWRQTEDLYTNGLTLAFLEILPDQTNYLTLIFLIHILNIYIQQDLIFELDQHPRSAQIIKVCLDIFSMRRKIKVFEYRDKRAFVSRVPPQYHTIWG